MRLPALGAFALALTLGTAANAANLIVNGDFNTTTFGSLAGWSGSEVDPAFGNAGAVTGWTSGTGAGDTKTYNIWFKGDGTEKGGNTGTDAKSRWGEAGQRPNANYTGVCNLAGCGGAFMVLDGDPVANGPFAQTITGLLVGKTYQLTFDWAAGELQDRTGYSTEQLNVSFIGSVNTQTQSTAAFTNHAGLTSPGDFSGWKAVSMFFTATSATETVSFLSVGTPSNNLPPVAFLDHVSLNQVPEPATWAMMLLGFGGLGAMLRRRRALAATA